MSQRSLPLLPGLSALGVLGVLLGGALLWFIPWISREGGSLELQDLFSWGFLLALTGLAGLAAWETRAVARALADDRRGCAAVPRGAEEISRVIVDRTAENAGKARDALLDLLDDCEGPALEGLMAARRAYVTGSPVTETTLREGQEHLREKRLRVLSSLKDSAWMVGFAGSLAGMLLQFTQLSGRSVDLAELDWLMGIPLALTTTVVGILASGHAALFAAVLRSASEGLDDRLTELLGEHVLPAVDPRLAPLRDQEQLLKQLTAHWKATMEASTTTWSKALEDASQCVAASLAAERQAAVEELRGAASGVRSQFDQGAERIGALGAQAAAQVADQLERSTAKVLGDTITAPFQAEMGQVHRGLGDAVAAMAASQQATRDAQQEIAAAGRELVESARAIERAARSIGQHLDRATAGPGALSQEIDAASARLDRITQQFDKVVRLNRRSVAALEAATNQATRSAAGMVELETEARKVDRDAWLHELREVVRALDHTIRHQEALHAQIVASAQALERVSGGLPKSAELERLARSLDRLGSQLEDQRRSLEQSA